MSKFISDHLPESLLARLSRSESFDHANVAIVVCSVDEHGWPHPAMLTTLEVVARDARNIRLAMHGRSRTARNMQTNGMLTLILADEHGVFYVKGDVRLTAPSVPSVPDLAAFNLRIDSVLEDNPAAYEKARIASGITVVRDDADRTRAEALLTELLAD
jgi:hypothetical protein